MAKRRSPRLYIPLDARFFDDDKVIQAGERAGWLFLSILSAIKLDQSDGTISSRKIARLAINGWEVRLEKLIQVGLIQEMESPEVKEITYLIPSWSRWNLLSYEIENRREMGREAAERRWRGTKPDAKPNGSPIQNPMQREEKNKERQTHPVKAGELSTEFLARLADHQVGEDSFN